MASRYNPRGLLSPLQSLNIGGGVDPLSNIDPLRGQSLMGQNVRPSTSSLIEMQPQQQGLFGRIGSGISGAADAVGSEIGGAARGLGDVFTGEGSSARLTALAAALSQGPSATPVSLGRSLTQGLTAGNIAAQQEAERKRKLLIEELKAKRAGGSLAAQKTSPKTYLTVDGDGQMTPVETYFDKIRGERLISGTNQPLPAGSIEFGPSDLPTFKNLDTFNKVVTEEEEKLIALDKFKNAIEASPEGYKRTLQGLNQVFQAFLSDPNFEKGDLATGEARARLQGLIGRYKDEIVGGGVMTEQDALRVIEALGGEISAFNPKELTLKIVNDFRENSERKYQSALKKYNKAYEVTLPTMAGKRIFNKREAYVSPFSEKFSGDGGGQDSLLTDAQRKKYGLE